MYNQRAILTCWVSLTFVLILSGCSSSNKALVRFSPKPPELYSKKSLAQILKNSPSPKIVLRVPASLKDPGAEVIAAQPKTSSRGGLGTSEDIVCNAIEKQLFRSGFKVRDRTLFNEVLKKAGDIDYTTVNGLTDTDLILELVKLNTAVPYVTNKYYQLKKKGEVERILSDPEAAIRLSGGLVEFRLIHVRTNDVVGTYLFNYAPCVDGCPYEIASNGRLVKAGTTTGKATSYEIAGSDYLDRFMTRATQQLVQAIKQTPAAVSGKK